MPMRPNLDFAGYSDDVLNHYQAALGGEAEITRFAGGMPEQHIPPGWGDKILYARLVTPFDETSFARRSGMAADKSGVRRMVAVAAVTAMR